MNKSKQVERIATMIQESLLNWETIGGTSEAKQEHEIKQFPKMYHPTEEIIKIPIYTDGTKIVITIEKVDIHTVKNTEDGESQEIKSESDDLKELFVEMNAQQVYDRYIKSLISNPNYKLPETGTMLFYAKKHPEGYDIDRIIFTSLDENHCVPLIESVMNSNEFAGWPFGRLAHQKPKHPYQIKI